MLPSASRKSAGLLGSHGVLQCNARRSQVDRGTRAPVTLLSGSLPRRGGQPLSIYRREMLVHDAESILNAFQRAVKVAERLPNAGPAEVANRWPEVLQINYECLVHNIKPSNGLTTAELDEFNRTVSWSAFLKEEAHRRLLWAYASGVSSCRIAKALSPSIPESAISRRILWALAFISYKVNHGETPPRFEHRR